MNVLKRVCDVLMTITCILSGFVIYGCAGQRSLPQGTPLLTDEEITEQRARTKVHLREFNSWEPEDSDKTEKIEKAIREIQNDSESPLL